MINRIKQLLSATNSDNPLYSTASEKLLACAALMTEVMVIDRQISTVEKQQITDSLQHRFGLSPEEAEDLLTTAEKEVGEATSLYQFTKTINSACSDQQKFELIQQLWEVAYVDEHLDKHEEAIIRRIADLIHLPHSQFIRAKQQALLVFKGAN